MTEQTGQPAYTPEQLATAREQIQGQDAGLGPVQPADPEGLGAQVAAGQAAAGQPVGGTEVDVAAILATIKALQSRVDAMERERGQASGPPVLTTAQALRAQLAEHASGKTTGAQDPDRHAELLGLADDLTEAAAAAVKSGDGQHVRKITGRIVAAMRRAHPGPGEHHHWRQAESYALDMDDAADNIPAPLPELPVGAERRPVKVTQGSIVSG